MGEKLKFQVIQSQKLGLEFALSFVIKLAISYYKKTQKLAKRQRSLKFDI